MPMHEPALGIIRDEFYIVKTNNLLLLMYYQFLMIKQQTNPIYIRITLSDFW
jgi:hypothetical protein